jgi:hypothetical protein
MNSKPRASAAIDFGLAASASLTKLQKRWEPGQVELRRRGRSVLIRIEP